MTRLRNRHFLINDLVLLPVAVYFSYLLRLEGISPTSQWWPGMVVLAATITLSTVLVFYLTGVYSRYWRYASIDELMLLTGAFTVATLLSAVIGIGLGFVFVRELWIPRSIPFILLLLGLAVTAGPRLSVRIRLRQTKRSHIHRGQLETVLIMGAGDTGATLLSEIRNNPQLGLDVVGLLDDDHAKHDVVIHGVRVMGDRKLIPALSRKHDVDKVIIAMPTAPGKEIREVVRICEEAHVQTQTVPGMLELLDGRVGVSQVRDVRIDDLLRREPITTDLAAVSDLLSGKRVLITGGGGSIGGELARQVQKCGPSKLTLVGHGENSIFSIYHELLDRSQAYEPASSTVLRPVIADIRSDAQMNALLAETCPDVIFHAAAHKHVPLMEMNPVEAVLNNVGGTRCLLRAAERHDVSRFVMISTDKAVNPTNVMGATKRIAERLVQDAAACNGRTYVTVRFGNVLGSRGSVVPRFQQQIASGGPVTVTHPEVRRYFMTIPEAVQLVLQASVLGEGGELFMLDMGEPVKIADLARDLIRLSGLELERDIDIVFTGLRPGEKISEEMFMSTEQYARTQHAHIYISKNGKTPLPSTLDVDVERLLRSAHENNIEMLLACLHALVPEYQPASPQDGSRQNGAFIELEPAWEVGDDCISGRELQEYKVD